MNKKGFFDKYLLKYELINALSNFIGFFFGVIFPILMTGILSKTVTKGLSEEMKRQVITGIIIAMVTIIILSIMLVSYAASISLEVEHDIPIRLNLFGLSDKKYIFHKLLTYYIVFTGSLIVYFGINGIIFSDYIIIPKIPRLLIYALLVYIISAMYLVLAHGIAVSVKKFEATYAVTMILNFATMILSGIFGIKVSDMPIWMQKISALMPTSYISDYNMLRFLNGASYNFAPLLQSIIFWLAVSLLLFHFGSKRGKGKRR